MVWYNNHHSWFFYFEFNIDKFMNTIEYAYEYATKAKDKSNWKQVTPSVMDKLIDKGKDYTILNWKHFNFLPFSSFLVF